MIVLLDTTVLIDALRARRNRRRELAAMVEDGTRLVTSAVNVAEIYAGCRPEEKIQTEAFLSTMDTYSITAKIARMAGMLKAREARRGRTVSLADMLIAATAVEHGCVLMTENRKDFVVEGLRVI